MRWKKTERLLVETLDRHPVKSILVIAFAVTLAVEMISRHSPWQGLVFLFTHPVHFIANMAIVLTTLAVSFLFQRRLFLLPCVSLFWLVMGIVNGVVLVFRATPFSLTDIALLPSVFPVMTVYLEVWQIVLLAAGIVLALAGLVMLFRRAPKRTPPYRRVVPLMAVSLAVALGIYGLTAAGKKTDRQALFHNIGEAYRQYGFVYCFCTEVFDRGVDEPGSYTRAAVEKVVESLEEVPAPEVRPNVVMVQLESFFDVSYLDDVSCAENPIPVFTRLKRDYSSGFLTVPSVGEGTANTEFEILSGMSMGFFGMGEYPYQSILREEACETVATDLKDLGYAAHAIHNNAGTFYGRNEVFAQLGFDTFTSIEYMRNVSYNPVGWCRDEVLTEEIVKALDDTAGQDFVFTITVQGHGKYQRGVDSPETEGLNIVWEDNAADSEAFAYYVSQLRETDAFIGALVAALEQRGEPTVLVLYGDHLPNFNIGTDQLENGDIFQTEYVVWDNMGLPREDKDLCAYQLSAQVLERLGIGGGLLSRYHQQAAGREDYIDGLDLLEYDMLYGQRYCFGGKNPYTKSPLRMGVDTITIRGADWSDGMLVVHGSHFTTFSRIAVDGDALDTVFVSDSVLTAELKKPPKDGAVITVRQDTATKATLSETAGLMWTEPEP